MKISVPDLNFTNAMRFCHGLKDIRINEGDICEIDFSEVGNCDPFPMLIVSNVLKRLQKYNNGISFCASNCNNDYASYMRFYSACGFGSEESVEEARHKSGYNTITKLSVKELREEGIQSNSIIQEIIDNKAKTMAEIVAQGNKAFQNWLSYALTEIIRNIPEHSESDTIWYCAQYWPKYDLVELAILDEGIGIKESLLKGGKIDSTASDLEAIKLSLEPGISGAGTPIFDEDWKNSGYGLYMVSQMCAELEASFIISSGTGAVIIRKENGSITTYERDSYVGGTAIQIRVRPSNTPDYEAIRKRILKRGEERAKSIKDSIHSASRASRGFGPF